MDERAQQFRVEAIRCRSAAETTKDRKLGRTMIELAEKYENLANGIEADLLKRRQQNGA